VKSYQDITQISQKITEEGRDEVSRGIRLQRWNDHRYYHHSRINQSLHFVSAASFLCAYVLMFTDPVAAALVGWLVSMTTRQAGHMFFEPKGYDHVNHATMTYNDEIKVGYIICSARCYLADDMGRFHPWCFSSIPHCSES